MIYGAYFNKNVVKNPFNCALRSFHLTFNWKQSIREVKTRVLWEQVVSKFPGGTRGKGPVYAGDVDSIPGLGRSPGEGNGNQFQCSCLENPMDRGAWQAPVHGITKSQMQLE